MNCANHPETPAVAYCQFCGKPLCTQCVHKVGSVVACEPCLAARLGGQQIHAGGAQFIQTAEGMYATDGKGNSYSQGPGYQHFSSGPLPPGAGQPHAWGTQPWVAFGLGWIPGVGAMYNGQFAKGLIHVLIFALLVNLANYNDILGIVVAAWLFYQVFDAYQTAIARRDGLPLPNPLGLNDVGHWFGGRGPAGYPGAGTNPGASPSTNPVNPPYAGTTGPATAGEGIPSTPFATGFTPPPMPPVPPGQYDMPDLWHSGGRGVPTGAIILIILGVGFLLGNLGILSQYWMERSWPLLLIAIGVWLVIRRSQTPPTPRGGVQ